MPAGQHVDGVPLTGMPVDPYVVPGDSSSGLLPEITGVGVEPNGTGDNKIQAYNFRMCLCRGARRTGPVPQSVFPFGIGLMMNRSKRLSGGGFATRCRRGASAGTSFVTLGAPATSRGGCWASTS